MAGVHAGKVLTDDHGPGVLRGNFEYAVEVFPFWQSYTPRFQRESCVAVSTPGGSGGQARLSSARRRTRLAGRIRGAVGDADHPALELCRVAARLMPWVQGAGGLLWTNHKYPAFGGTPYNLQNDGPNAETSVWNFTPQGGVGLHYFVSPKRSIDLARMRFIFRVRAWGTGTRG